MAVFTTKQRTLFERNQAQLVATPTINGWTLVAMPVAPGFRTVSPTIVNTVGTVTSPFSMQTQIMKWPGADLWKFKLSLPEMCRKEAQPWYAFLMQAEGTGNVFMVGDPSNQAPVGAVRGTPIVDGINSANNKPGTKVLVTKGWQPRQNGLLEPGDYIQVGVRLHTVQSIVNSDASGAATIHVGPSLREQPADATPIITAYPRGLFRLASNSQTWSADQTRFTSLSFDVVEV